MQTDYIIGAGIVLYEKETENSDEENTRNGSDITFDADVIRISGQNESSLEDIYGIPVFSNDLNNRINTENKKKEAQYDDIFNDVFKNQKNNEIDYIFESVIKSDDVKLVISNYKKNDSNVDNWLYSMSYITVGMIFAIMIVLTLKKIKKNKKYENNSYNN